MKKVIVIGCPGAGKSTFARKLRDITMLPLFYCDMLYHNADKTTVSKEVFDSRLKNILSQKEWIIDGHYQRTLSLRLDACDTVFFLDYPTSICLANVEKRIGTKREDMPWIEETFDAKFKQYIIDFNTVQRAKIINLLDSHKGLDKYVFTDPTQADDFLKKFER